ncbi:MAG: phosphoribosylformylglycinamidine synthase subunit PurL [Fimbriimonadaceae bacterium]|jgi:phosphoribosylformylglycinamidine synthase|nr:phosphoribosylformylglycinamidine synthase subunit PurL [Fimbriimonadaceae bacterium]
MKPKAILKRMDAITPDVYLSMGLTESEFQKILTLMGRTPTLTEIGMFAVMWSEHCGYKYSRPILRYFKKYRDALDGEGLENAGIIPIGDGLGIVMKVESHNHPSAVEPYQGAATGVGGIIRDIFTMGARPIAGLNSLRFGPIHEGGAESEVVLRNRYLCEHVVAGIGGYGNCVGVPTVAGEVAFHPRYSGNPLVNAMAVGIVKIDEVTTAGAAGEGNPVIYLGSATGKDGIHGATFASDALGAENEDKRPNVQIGDPFAEKLLIEATLEALKTGAIQSIQDMGAAGLTCSTVEMSSKGEVGMDVNLDLVPMRESDMSAYELMLSESQERMLCVAFKGREQEVISVFEKWGLKAVVIGHVTPNGLVTVRRHGKIEAQVVASQLADECPTYTVIPEEPGYYRAAESFSLDDVPVTPAEEALSKLMSAPSLASKEWIFRQYDSQVQTQTSLPPGQGDAAVLAPRGTDKGLALKIDGNSRWVYLNPYVGGQLAVAEACRNVACTGGLPVGATDGLNFGNPTYPHVYWQFERAVKGIADACEIMQTPVVSGNVSFYNESDLGEVPPTPLIGILGILNHASRRIGMGSTLGQVDLHLVWYENDLGLHQGLGASSYLAEVHGIESGWPVAPNLPLERVLCEWLASQVDQQRLKLAHDVSEGGLAFCLAEIALASERGLEVNLQNGPWDPLTRPDSVLFGEFPGWVVVGVDPDDTAALSGTLPPGLRSNQLGRLTSQEWLLIRQNDQILLQTGQETLYHWHNSCIPQVLWH